MKKILIPTIVALCLCFQYATAQDFNTIIGEEGNDANAGENITSGDFNTIIGDSTALGLTFGERNTIIGYQAGRNFNGDELVAIGYQAGFTSSSTSSLFDNVFIGAEAGRLTTTGLDNVFIGTEAGENNTTGSGNVFLGEETGTANTTGSDNVFIGEDAGTNNTIGAGNVFIGGDDSSLDNSIYPDFTGGLNAAGYDNAEGNFNTFLGAAAGSDSGNSNSNTFIGYSAGGNSETVDECTFVGAFAGWDNNRFGFGQNQNESGARNNYFGFAAGGTNRNGEDNIGIGHSADFIGAGSAGSSDGRNNRNVFVGNSSLVLGDDIVLVGHNADVRDDNSIAIGSQVDLFGQNSIAIGYDADIVDAADNAVGIGHQVDIDGLQATAVGSNTVVSGTNATAIGYQANVAANNEIFLGNSAIASIGGVVNWTATSDGRFKKNVQENVVGLDFINRLRPVTYNYDANKLHAQKGFETETLADALKKKAQVRYSGFLAQEVEAAAQQLGYDFSGVDAPQNEEDIYGLRYAEFVVPLVKAVQELSDENEQKDQLIAQQAAELATYKKLLGDLTARVEALEANESSELSVVLEK